MFSDEFSDASRPLGTPRDARWTAVDMYYSSDFKEYQNYKPDHVEIADGALRITLDANDTEGERTSATAGLAPHASAGALSAGARMAARASAACHAHGTASHMHTRCCPCHACHRCRAWRAQPCCMRRRATSWCAAT